MSEQRLSEHSRGHMGEEKGQIMTALFPTRSPQKERCSERIAFFGLPCYSTSIAGETAWAARSGLKLIIIVYLLPLTIRRNSLGGPVGIETDLLSHASTLLHPPHQ